MTTEALPPGSQFATATTTPNEVKVEYATTQENRAVLDPPVEQVEESTTPLAQSATGGTASTAEAPPAESQAKKFANLAKLERKIAKQKAEAEELLNRAQAVRGAFDEPDLIKAITDLGLDPEQVYKKMTEHALAKINAKPKDPIQAKLQEQEEQIKSYASSIKKIEDQLNQEKELAQHEKAKAQHVAPLINADPDKYQATLAFFDDNKEQVIQHIYHAMITEYQTSGKVVSATDAAEALENYYSNLLEQGIQKAQKLSRFKNRFSDISTEDSPANATHERSSTTNSVSLSPAESFSQALSAKLDPNNKAHDKSPKTLTNHMSPNTTIRDITKNGNISMDERIQALLKSLA